MKCLLCSSKFENQNDLLNHYVTYHNIDKNNWFFQKSFQIRDKTVLRQWIRCDEFLTTNKHKAVHNFLKHYEDGKSIPFEKKPVDVLRLPTLTIYSIEYSKYKDFYNFYNSEDCLDDFLRNVKFRLKSGCKKWIKCSFTIDNIQNASYQGFRPILYSRYWTTSPHEGNYFNDFIFYGLEQEILSRVIINGMSGSSWNFKRFISLSVKVLDNYTEAVV